MSQRYRGDNFHDQLFVKVFTTAQVVIGRTWNTRDVCSGYWRLYHNDRTGAALELADGTHYPLPAHRIHFVPAWVRFSCRNTRRISHCYIHFDLIGVSGVAVQRLFHKPLTLPPDGHLDAAVHRLAPRLQCPTPATLCEAKALVYAALAQLLTTLRFDALPAAPNPVASAQQFIEQNLGTLMTNAQLAALCHFSEDHFVRLFRRHLGQTPAQYILERRIATATHHLAFTDASIEQIATELGFANRYHFTKMYTRRMRLSPAAYRQQTRV